MRLLVALVIVLSSNVSANALGAKLIIGAKSFHFNSESHKYLNEANPSVGIKISDIKTIYVSKNSWNEKSIYLTYSPELKINKYISASIDAGIASGYKCSNQVTTNGHKFHMNGACNKYGITPLYAITVNYSPLHNNFAVSVSVNHRVAMLAFSYSL